MKLAPMTVFMLRDSEGFASAISESLLPNPSSSSFTRRQWVFFFSFSFLSHQSVRLFHFTLIVFVFGFREDSFELSLEIYGIKDHKASGNVIHYVDNHAIYKVLIFFSINYHCSLMFLCHMSRKKNYINLA
jgi:hypothetical protein